MGLEFTFYDYIDDKGVNVVHEWLYGAGKDSRARFNLWIPQMEAAPPGSTLWQRPYWDGMKGRAWQGLYEMRKTGKIQFRLIVCRDPGGRNVTILAGGVHKDKRWTPHNLAEQAQERKRRLFENLTAHREAHRE